MKILVTLLLFLLSVSTYAHTVMCSIKSQDGNFYFGSGISEYDAGMDALDKCLMTERDCRVDTSICAPFGPVTKFVSEHKKMFSCRATSVEGYSYSAYGMEVEASERALAQCERASEYPESCNVVCR